MPAPAIPIIVIAYDVAVKTIVYVGSLLASALLLDKVINSADVDPLKGKRYPTLDELALGGATVYVPSRMIDYHSSPLAKHIAGSAAATAALAKVMESKHRCDCKNAGKLAAKNRYMSAFAAIYQWTVVSAIDPTNLLSGRYRLRIGHDATEKAQKEDPGLLRADLQKVFDIKNIIGELNTKSRHIQITEYDCAGVEFDGFWPSYCTFVEVKYGYGAKSKPEWRNGWLKQASSQAKAVHASSVAKTQTSMSMCPPNLLCWVFSNEDAKNHFDVSVMPFLKLVPTFSIVVSQKAIKLYQTEK